MTEPWRYRAGFGGVSRLGAIDPEQEPYKTELADYQVTVIDLTKIKAGDSVRHNKFAELPQIVQLIGTRLASGQAITDLHVGLGEHIIQGTAGAATAVGAAAGLVIAAPVAALDQDTREHYGDHVKQLGASIAGNETTHSISRSTCSPSSPSAAATVC